MKNTIIMLSVIFTFIITWLFLAAIGWAFDIDDTLKFNYYVNHDVTTMIMIVFGWIPSVFVAIDVSEKLEKTQ